MAKPLPATITCDKEVCSRGECCNPVCTSRYKCRKGRVLKASPNTVPCMGAQCSDEDCCMVRHCLVPVLLRRVSMLQPVANCTEGQSYALVCMSMVRRHVSTACFDVHPLPITMTMMLQIQILIQATWGLFVGRRSPRLVKAQTTSARATTHASALGRTSHA